MRISLAQVAVARNCLVFTLRAHVAVAAPAASTRFHPCTQYSLEPDRCDPESNEVDRARCARKIARLGTISNHGLGFGSYPIRFHFVSIDDHDRAVAHRFRSVLRIFDIYLIFFSPTSFRKFKN